MPSIEVLAARQRAASLLCELWPQVSEKLGGLSGDAVVAGSSEVHGIGLFAQRDIKAGEIVALHPVHRVLQTLDGGRVAGALADEEDAAYFRPAEGFDPDELAYRNMAYRQCYSHVDPGRPECFLLDANPLKPDVPGWLGHRINDGASLSPSSHEVEMIEYYAASRRRANCCVYALCVPLLAFVATADVSSGEELLTTYGHAYWMQASPQLSGKLEAEVTEWVRERDLFQLSVDKRYSPQIRALDEFIVKYTANLEAAAEEQPSPPPPASREPATAPPPRESTGFGGGGAVAKSKKKKRKGK